ncbi:MAG: MauE/DoxX family redox-associated membrane protein [Planctomycetota bacterium]
MSTAATGSPARPLGFLLCRIVVPAWILVGVIFKLVHNTPQSLPKRIWEAANDAGIDLFLLLFILVALEVFAIAVMVFLGRWSRIMAIWMLACFCVILIGEMAAGNTSCGCLGAKSPPPWVMLAIDGGLLLGVIFGGRPYRKPARKSALPYVLAAFTLGIGVAITGVTTLPKATLGSGDNGNGGTGTGTGTGGGGSETPEIPPTWPTPTPVPDRAYYIPETSEWMGKKLNKIDMMQFVAGWPDDILEGQKYVILYSKSCEHCQQFLEDNFIMPSPVDAVLVTIPDTPSGFEPASWLNMMFDRSGVVAELELPEGYDYFMTPPMCIALEDGVVQCVKSAEDGEGEEGPEGCLLYHY